MSCDARSVLVVMSERPQNPKTPSDFLIIINNKDVFQIVYCITLGSVYETTNVGTDVNQKLLLSRPAPRPLELRATYSGQENH